MAIGIHTDETLAIGEVARAAGVSTSKIRYYERRGLLPAPKRVSGRRRYDDQVLRLLRIIEVSQAAGFSLREIEQLLHGFRRGAAPSQRWRALATAKLSEVDALIARAQAMRALLERGVDCDCLTPGECELLEDGATASGFELELSRTAV
jgi:MerR family transcriptional regulator, redox-sensitive transcriptional activator SoxR